jgi:acyl dehydratase
MSVPWEHAAIGDEVASGSFDITRDQLVRYAGASGDFNPIHYRDDVAQQVGLEGVLAHGMLTMGLALSPVLSWLGGRGTVRQYQVRFTKPVYVPAQGSTTLTSTATLSRRDEEASGDITLTLTVKGDLGQSVLGKALVVVAPR